MTHITHFRFYLQMAVVAGITYAGWVFVNRHLATLRWDNGRSQEQAKRNAEFERIYGGTDVRVLHFYSPTAILTEGDHATICYGVVNAKSVRLEPPVEGVSVSLNRCVEVAPEQDTRYTLFAEGNDGRTVTESFALTSPPGSVYLTKGHFIPRRANFHRPWPARLSGELRSSERRRDLDRAPGLSYVAPRAEWTLLRDARQDHHLHA